MLPRHLFGPVSGEFADDYLAAVRATGDCMCFGSGAGVDVPLAAHEGWHELAARLPEGWRPELLVLWMQYSAIAAELWQAPVPIVALAGDANLQWHSYCATLPFADLVLSDATSVEALARAGITQARQGHLFGLPRSMAEAQWPDGPRPIDVLFIGNFHPDVQRERLPWIGRLAGLVPRRRVVIRAGVFGAEYRDLLAKSRIVFNRAVRGECNMRVFEAIAAGALLFQERGNREVPALLEDRRECVYYGADDLEELLDYYLDREDERAAIAAAARRKIPDLSFAGQWQDQLQRLTQELPALRERAARRMERGSIPSLEGQVWQAASAVCGSAAEVVHTLEQTARSGPRSSALENALGAAHVLHAPKDPGLAARAFHDAWNADPRNVVAGCNLTEVLVRLGQRDNAIQQARRTLAMLDEQSALASQFLDAPLLPAGYDHLRVEWERAGRDHAGQPADVADTKARLLRWRLHTVLAQLTGDLVHHHEAAMLRPDLPATCRALGCALGRANRPSEALPHLQAAVEGNPFDREAAAALSHTLGLLGRTAPQQRLAQQRRALSMAAPGLVPPEAWFAEGLAPVPAQTVPATEARLRVAWQGSQGALHSLALVNREICAELLGRGHEVTLLPSSAADAPGTAWPLPETLQCRVGQALSGPADVTVRHQWPPDFTAPAEGHWVMIQPWEFGSLPRAWLGPMTQLLDEVWVPSRFVRDSFIKSGVPADRVHVVPNGVGPEFFTDAVPYPLRTSKQFKFLFVGGTIERKGIDVLLKAYQQTFSARDNVCLVIKDMGVGTFYQGQTMQERIAYLANAPDAPRVEYLNQRLSTEELAGLYRACDCLVAPYRGEGFGMPIAEAMACGLPVIVTGYGAALDFCREEWAYLIPARPVPLPDARVDALETVDRPHLAEPDGDALRMLLRHVVEHPEEAKAKAALAREHIRAHYTWAHVTSLVEQRLVALRQRPIRRREKTSEVSKTSEVFAAGRPKVSLVMIVKNEEKNLAACLGCIADLVQEIVIVDTGSADRTVEIAQRFGARVFHFSWIDDFSAARNDALRHATGEWIFWMDADDRLDETNRVRLRRQLAQLPSGNIAFSMKCYCLAERGSNKEVTVDHVRLFRNLPGLAWEHRLHEQILPALRSSGAATEWLDVVIHHLGYQDPQLLRQKHERDLRILLLDYQERPNHPFTLFNLGTTYREMGRIPEALDLLRRSLRGSEPSDSIVRKLYVLIARCESQLNRVDEALVTCREGRRHYPDDAELLYEEAQLLRALHDPAGAVACLDRLLAGRDTAHFASVHIGLAGYLTRHLLALCYFDLQRLDDAEAQWRQVLAEKPRYLPALIGLGDVYLARSSWPLLDDVLAELDTSMPGSLPAAVLRGRKHMALGEHPVARDWLGRAIAQYPHEIWPRVLYSRVLMQDGSDRAAVAQALRDVLAMDPNHVESRRHLEALLNGKDEHKNGP